MRPWKDFVKNRSAAAFIATMIFASNAPQSAENAADGPLQGCEVIDSGQSRDVDSIPQTCKSDVAAGRVINWLRVDLGRLDPPDPMFSELKPGDGHVVIYAAPVSQVAGSSMSVDELRRRRMLVRPQGEAPDSLYALLHTGAAKNKLLPLNYSLQDPSRIELPWRPAQLAAAYDAENHVYLFYPAGAPILTPPWDSSLASWQTFYVWWFDPRKETIERRLLPPGPWVGDATRDGVLGRAVRNFSCGTDCYRHYEIKVASGIIYVTISGRPSAVSEDITGTYKLGRGDSWEKIKG